MRFAAGTLLLALAALAATVRADVSRALPTPFPEARYQQMSVKSPFAVATAAAPTAAPTPGFAANLYVNGIARVGSSDFVTLKTKGDDKSMIFLEVGKPAKDGLLAERVAWSDVMGKSTVDLAKAGEKATVSFDQAEIAKAVAPAVNPAPPGIRGGFRRAQYPGEQGTGPRQPGLPGVTYAQPGQFGDQQRMQFRRRNLIAAPAPVPPGAPMGPGYGPQQ